MQIQSIFKQHFKKYCVAPPTQLDFYRIGRTLGRGAFGKVSLCLHKLAHSLVAVKSIKKNASDDIKSRTLVEMQLI